MEAALPVSILRAVLSLTLSDGLQFPSGPAGSYGQPLPIRSEVACNFVAVASRVVKHWSRVRALLICESSRFITVGELSNMGASSPGAAERLKRARQDW